MNRGPSVLLGCTMLATLLASTPAWSQLQPSRDYVYLGSRLIAVDADTLLSVVEPAPVTEGNSGSQTTVTFLVNLSSKSWREVTVDYATVGGTTCHGPIAGVDFVPTSGTLHFAPGVQQVALNLTILGDTLPEGDESVPVVFSNPVNASFAGNAPTLTARAF